MIEIEDLWNDPHGVCPNCGSNLIENEQPTPRYCDTHRCWIGDTNHYQCAGCKKHYDYFERIVNC